MTSEKKGWTEKPEVRLIRNDFLFVLNIDYRCYW